MKSREFVAIPVVLVLLGVLFVLMLAAEAGIWAWVVVVTALVAVGLLAIAIAVGRHRHPPAFDAPSTAAPSSTPASGGYRVLVVADETLTPEAFGEEIAPHAAGRPVEVFVVAPALRSRLAHWTGDDSERHRAETHLEETVSALASAGIPTTGEIGSDDPVQAADDALRTYPADEVAFVTGRDDPNWLERGVLELARGRYRIPVTHVAVESSMKR